MRTPALMLSEMDLMDAASVEPVQEVPKEVQVEPEPDFITCSVDLSEPVDEEDITMNELRKAILLLREVDSLFFILPMQTLKRELLAPVWWDMLKIEDKVRRYIAEWEFEEPKEI